MARPEVTGQRCTTGKRASKALAALAPPNTPTDEPKKKKTSRNKTAQRALFAGLPDAAFTISTFCTAHHLSESFYHKLKQQGRGPKEMHVGARVLISFESAAAWRAEREAETAMPMDVAT